MYKAECTGHMIGWWPVLYTGIKKKESRMYNFSKFYIYTNGFSGIKRHYFKHSTNLKNKHFEN